MNFRTTFILVGFLAVALGFYIFANWSSDDQQAANAPPKDDGGKGRKLLDVKADDVRKAVVAPAEGAPAGAKPVELTQADGKWAIAKPISWAADPSEGRQFVDAIASARSIGSIELTPENAATTGLTKPRFRVELTDAAGKVHKLAVGERNALGYLYVQANDEKAGSLIAGGALGDRLGKTTDQLVIALRDKSLLKFQSFDVKQVTVAAGDAAPAFGGADATPNAAATPPPLLALQRVGFEWKMTAPVQEPAESTEASDLVSSVAGLRADEFVDDATSAANRAGFDRPRAVVVLSTAAPSTQPTATAPAGGPATAPAPIPGGVTVVIGQPVDIKGDKSWVKVSGPTPADPVTVAKVPLNKAAVEKLTKATPLSLRDRRVFTVPQDEVSEVTIAVEAPAGATRPATQPVKLTRRVEKLELGPFLPKPPTTTAPAAGAATQPAATPSAATPAGTQPAATPPAAAPATGPATKPSALLRAGGSPLLALVGLLQAAPAPAAPAATQPAAPGVTSLENPAAAALTAALPATKPTTAAEPSTTQPSATPQTQPAAPATTPAAPSPTTAAAAAATAAPAAPAEPPMPAVPPKPPTKWVLASAGDADADDAAVSGLLSDLSPLRAAKYLEKAPAPAAQPGTQPTATAYVVTVKAVAAGGAVTTYELHITDPGGEAKPVGRYNDFVFELDRELLTKLTAGFAAKKP